MKIAIYLKFNGNCEEAYNFYASIFNANKMGLMKYESYMTDDITLDGKIFHGELKIHDFYLYMSDESISQNEHFNRFKITLECDSRDEMLQIYQQLNQGGTELSRISKMPWGMEIGQVKDKFGVDWDVTYCKNE